MDGTKVTIGTMLKDLLDYRNERNRRRRLRKRNEKRAKARLKHEGWVANRAPLGRRKLNSHRRFERDATIIEEMDRSYNEPEALKA